MTSNEKNNGIVHMFGCRVGFLTKFRFAKISRNLLRNDFRVSQNEGRVSQVSQFRETAEITKETSFAKHENRENEKNSK
jgi:hypothetical protein